MDHRYNGIRDTHSEPVSLTLPRFNQLGSTWILCDHFFEHESFTDLILALNHLTEELKARGDLSALPPSDKSHLTTDIQRAYTRLIYEWITYMEYLKTTTLTSSALQFGRTRLTSQIRLLSVRLPDFSTF
jgi:hypothetical protein